MPSSQSGPSTPGTNPSLNGSPSKLTDSGVPASGVPSSGVPSSGVPSSRVLAWAQVARIGLVPSAPSNVILGALIASSPSFPSVIPLLGLCLSSIALYLGGMVLNDWFDRGIDAVERPGRPIPSGRVSATAARNAGVFLLVLGVAIAGSVSFAFQCPLAVSYAGLIAVLVIAYNGWAKSTIWGPMFMGSCRTVNVLLGTAVACSLPNAYSILASISVGCYIAGVTTMARYEAQSVPAWSVWIGRLAALIPMGLAIAVVFGLETPAGPWTLLMVFFVVVSQTRILDQLASSPSGPMVPRQIGALLGQLIRIDTILASAWVGFAGFTLLCLWGLALFLRRFKGLYSS